MGKYTPKVNAKLITHTGSHRKVIINLALAEIMLSKELFDQLNNVLVDVNDVQEGKRGDSDVQEALSQM